LKQNCNRACHLHFNGHFSAEQLTSSPSALLLHLFQKRTFG